MRSLKQKSRPLPSLIARTLPLIFAAAVIVPADTAQSAGAPAVSAGVEIPVTNCNNSGPGSLRRAIASALSGDTIDLRALGCNKITLTSGAIPIAQHNLTLLGPGRALTVSGNNASSVFRHSGLGMLRIEDLSIAYGLRRSPNTTAKGGCIYTAGSLKLKRSRVHHCAVVGVGDEPSSGFGEGGGIYARGDVTLLHSAVFRNSVDGVNGLTVTPSRAGGIYASGRLTAIHSDICHNRSEASAGGASAGGGLNARYANFNDNRAAQVGALAAGGDITLAHSTVARNYTRGSFTAFFRARQASDQIRIIDSTISGNTADGVSGVYLEPHFDIDNNNSALTVANSTIAFNHEPLQVSPVCGGALYWVGELHMDSTIIAGNTCEENAADLRITDSESVIGANNLIGTSNRPVPPDTIFADPRLAPLARNGGPTRTHALMADSLAIDMGNNAAGLRFDQRGPGFPRVKGPRADIGAYER